jgi:hypothetical protein
LRNAKTVQRFKGWEKSAHWKQTYKDGGLGKHGCEDCHGAGAAHVAGGGDLSKIFVFGKLESSDGTLDFKGLIYKSLGTITDSTKRETQIRLALQRFRCKTSTAAIRRSRSAIRFNIRNRAARAPLSGIIPGRLFSSRQPGLSPLLHRSRLSALLATASAKVEKGNA